MPCRSRVRTKGEPQSCIWYYYLKKSNLWSQHVWWTSAKTSLLWIRIQKRRSDRLFSNLNCVALLLGENDALLIQNASPVLVIWNTHSNIPLLSNYFLTNFFFVSSALLHQFKCNASRTQGDFLNFSKDDLIGDSVI